MDFPDTLKINVTAEDIAEGIPGNCANCPIALAALRAIVALGFDAYVTVDKYLKVYANPIGIKLAQFQLPARALDFIVAFDSRVKTSPNYAHDVKPFSCILH